MDPSEEQMSTRQIFTVTIGPGFFIGDVLSFNERDKYCMIHLFLNYSDAVVKTLHLNSGLTIDDVPYLDQALRNNETVESLCIDGPIEAGCMQLLSGCFSDSETLKLLHFRDCDLGADDADVLARVLQNNATLEELFLRNGGRAIGDEGVIALADSLSLPNATLKHFWILGCGVGNDGAAAIGRMLGVNHALEVLRLDFDGSNGNAAAMAIADGLSRNRSSGSLRILRLRNYFHGSNGNEGAGEQRNCGIGFEEAAAFSRALLTNEKLRQLTILNLNDDQCALAKLEVVRGLSWNTNLLQLEIDEARGLPLSVCNTKKMMSYLKANNFLEQFTNFDRCDKEGCVVCQNKNDGVSHWPYVYAKVASHPAALFHLLKKEISPEQLRFFREYVSDISTVTGPCKKQRVTDKTL
jgi:hypothetical protein